MVPTSVRKRVCVAWQYQWYGGLKVICRPTGGHNHPEWVISGRTIVNFGPNFASMGPGPSCQGDFSSDSSGDGPWFPDRVIEKAANPDKLAICSKILGSTSRPTVT